MQKYSDACINTSKFASLCNTNKRTLIHYDEIGLFMPAFTDERGYRYYSESQCDVFFTITCLKDIGMPLKEIKKYVNDKNPEDLQTLLFEQRKKVMQELEHLKRIEKVIENKLQLVSEGSTLMFDNGRCSRPFLQECEEEVFITTPYLGTSEHIELISSLFSHISLINKKEWNIGHPYGAMLCTKDLENNDFEKYAYFMTKSDISLEKEPENNVFFIHKKAKGQYAVIYLKGDYYDAEEALKKILSYIKEQGMTAGEYCYKEAIWDELTVEQMEDYITKISIKVDR